MASGWEHIPEGPAPGGEIITLAELDGVAVRARCESVLGPEEVRVRIAAPAGWVHVRDGAVDAADDHLVLQSNVEVPTGSGMPEYVRGPQRSVLLGPAGQVLVLEAMAGFQAPVGFGFMSCRAYASLTAT